MQELLTCICRLYMTWISHVCISHAVHMLDSYIPVQIRYVLSFSIQMENVFKP